VVSLAVPFPAPATFALSPSENPPGGRAVAEYRPAYSAHVRDFIESSIVDCGQNLVTDDCAPLLAGEIRILSECEFRHRENVNNQTVHVERRGAVTAGSRPCRELDASIAPAQNAADAGSTYRQTPSHDTDTADFVSLEARNRAKLHIGKVYQEAA